MTILFTLFRKHKNLIIRWQRRRWRHGSLYIGIVGKRDFFMWVYRRRRDVVRANIGSTCKMHLAIRTVTRGMRGGGCMVYQSHMHHDFGPAQCYYQWWNKMYPADWRGRQFNCFNMKYIYLFRFGVMMGQARCVCCADDRVLFFVFVIDIFAHKSVENQPEAAIIYRFTFLKTRRRHCVWII